MIAAHASALVDRYYACGSDAFVAAMRDLLAAAGVDKARVRHEGFG
jgi:ferredoxin-NADP reductase